MTQMMKRGWRSSPAINIDRPNQSVDPYDIAANMDRALRAQFEKASVQPTSSIYDQITSIINNTKPKFSSVGEAVADMQERSGFTSYQQARNDFTKMKLAQTEAPEQSVQPTHSQGPTESAKSSDPTMFKEHPEIKETFDNYIDDTRGNLSVPAVIDRVKAIHKHDVPDEQWNEDALVAYVESKCHEAKSHNQMPETQGLGKVTQFNDTSDVDPSNRDAFFGLNPAKASAELVVKTAAPGLTALQIKIRNVEKAEDAALARAARSDATKTDHDRVKTIRKEKQELLDERKKEFSGKKAEENPLLVALATFDSAKAPEDVKCADLKWLSKEDRAELKSWGTAKSVEGNPPAWVASEKTWDKAKKAVKKYWKRYDEPYAIVAHVFRNMGGKLKKPKNK
jgi:hypothetical protein